MVVTIRYEDNTKAARFKGMQAHYFLVRILPKCKNVPAKEPNKKVCYNVTEELKFSLAHGD